MSGWQYTNKYNWSHVGAPGSYPPVDVFLFSTRIRDNSGMRKSRYLPR